MMRFLTFIFLVGLSDIFAQPISLHPDNPHYFLYNNKITPLITSGEHYGSVLNLDFDYITYLNTLKQDNLNLTRIFTGSYVEKPGAFGISENTLAPMPAKFLAPWMRTDQSGYYLGGNKFDLDKWDEAYFSRLRDFVKQASDRKIIVEVTLFSSMYGDEGWLASPFHKNNNTNIKDTATRQQVNTLHVSSINTYQINMVKKIVQSLNEFDNVIYEIQNEPWADNGIIVGNTFQLDPTTDTWMNNLEIASDQSLAWQRMIVNGITSTERKLPKKHLIAQNFANFYQDLSTIQDKISPDVSLYNFHYNHPKAAFLNFHFNKALGFDESGFAGSTDSIYRRQAWRWMLSGGGQFDGLDYSFTVSTPQGTTIQKAPGGGSPTFRKQLSYLKSALDKLNLATARPDTTSFVTKDQMTSKSYCLFDNETYLIYIVGGQKVSLACSLPSGKYAATWFDPKTNKVIRTNTLEGKTTVLTSPFYKEDISLILKKK
jgi:hypothetical protein